jgi:hypothetical protein
MWSFNALKRPTRPITPDTTADAETIVRRRGTQRPVDRNLKRKQARS